MSSLSQYQKVLLVSYRFPPESSAGSVRSFKFAKYLPDLGWDVAVISVSNPPDDNLDKETLNALSKNIQFIRAPRLEPSQVRKFLEKIIPKRIRGIAWRIEKLMTYLLYPDFSVLWIFPALIKGLVYGIRHRPNVIYSTYAPIANHLVACALSKTLRIPWIADYRDLWVYDFEYQPASRIHGYLDKAIEKYICNAAYSIVTTSTGLTDIMRKQYPKHAHKIITIPNGFDPDDQPVQDGFFYKNKEEIIFSHIGTLYSSRSLNPLIDALENVLKEQEFSSLYVKLILVGNVSIQINATESVVIENCGWKPRHMALKILAKSDVCVLAMHAASGGEHPVPQKLYEYLAFGRYILAIGAKNSFSEKILSHRQYASCVSWSDKYALNEAIRDIFRLHKKNAIPQYVINDQFVDQFSRPRLAKQLDLLFKQAIRKLPSNFCDFEI